VTDYRINFDRTVGESIGPSASVSHISIDKGDIATFKVCVQLSANRPCAILVYANYNETMNLMEQAVISNNQNRAAHLAASKTLNCFSSET
jgi:hypothetical protein